MIFFSIKKVLFPKKMSKKRNQNNRRPLWIIILAIWVLNRPNKRRFKTRIVRESAPVSPWQTGESPSQSAMVTLEWMVTAEHLSCPLDKEDWDGGSVAEVLSCPLDKEDWDEGSMEAESFDSPVTVVSTGNDRATP